MSAHTYTYVSRERVGVKRGRAWRRVINRTYRYLITPLQLIVPAVKQVVTVVISWTGRATLFIFQSATAAPWILFSGGRHTGTEPSNFLLSLWLLQKMQPRKSACAPLLLSPRRLSTTWWCICVKSRFPIIFCSADCSTYSQQQNTHLRFLWERKR